MGGGSGGCTINLVDRSCMGEFEENVRAKYMEHCEKDPKIHAVRFIFNFSLFKKFVIPINVVDFNPFQTMRAGLDGGWSFWRFSHFQLFQRPSELTRHTYEIFSNDFMNTLFYVHYKIQHEHSKLVEIEITICTDLVDARTNMFCRVSAPSAQSIITFQSFRIVRILKRMEIGLKHTMIICKIAVAMLV